MVGEQLEKTGRAAAAGSFYEEAFRSRPEYAEGVVRYADFLIRTGAFDRALEIAETLRKDEKRQFVYRVIRGQALLGREEYEEALVELVQANKLYNSETGVLNSLGKCYMKLGRKSDALDAFNASLRLDPEQSEIKKLAAELVR
jgi:tetratricopeptide (TPR) repeat protein